MTYQNPFFDPVSDPGNRLGLLLQQTAVDPLELAHALLQVFYTPAYRLAAALLGPARAAAACQGIFAAAMQDAGRSRLSNDLKQWFYRNALSVSPLKDLTRAGRRRSRFQTPARTGGGHWLESLEPHSRLPALLHYLARLDAGEIAALLHQDPLAVAESLLNANSRLESAGLAGLDSLTSLAGGAWSEIHRPGYSADLHTRAELVDEQLVEVISARYPVPEPGAASLNAMAHEISRLAAHQTFVRQQATRLRQAGIAGVLFLAFLGFIVFATSGRMAAALASPPQPTPAPTPQITIMPEQAFQAQIQADPVQRVARQRWIPTSIYMAPGPHPPNVTPFNPGTRFAAEPGSSSSLGSEHPSLPVELTQVAPVVASSSVPSAAKSSDLLGMASTSAEISTELYASSVTWNSLWLDTYTFFYGMPGYDGPDREYRLQLWASADRMLALGGPPYGDPSEIWVGSSGRLVSFSAGTNHSLQSRPVADSFMRRPLVGNLVQIFDPLWSRDGFSSQVTFKPAGTARIAGREALIVNQLNQSGDLVSRLWLDRKTAMVLRNQVFQNDGDRLLMDIQVAKLEYDAGFDNPALFDLQHPWQGGFARNPEGQPDFPLTWPFSTVKPVQPPGPQLKNPPPGFDPSLKKLAFVYPPDFSLTSSQVEVAVVAENYSLGEVSFGNPWNLMCTRSANGKTIVFTSQPILDPFQTSPLQWLDLSKAPVQAHKPISGLYVRQMVISPDGSRLAVFGQKTGEEMGVYVVDLDSGTIQRQISVDQVQSMAWRRDATMLLIVGEENGQDRLELIGLAPAIEKILYRYPYDSLDSVLNNLMTGTWVTPFTAGINQLGSCVTPNF